jgi:hypothetical protein
MVAPTAPQVPRRLSGIRSGLVAAVTVLAATVAVIAYLVSSEAISAYVAGIGALPVWLRWCGPLLVDTFIILGTLFLLWLALSGIPLRRVWDAWYAWALIAAATGASAYLNAAHAPPRWDAWVVAGAVPLALLASVHLLVLLLLRVLAWTPSATGSATPAAMTVAPAEPAPAAATSGPLAAPSAGAMAARPQPRRPIGATRPVYDALVAGVSRSRGSGSRPRLIRRWPGGLPSATWPPTVPMASGTQPGRRGDPSRHTGRLLTMRRRRCDHTGTRRAARLPAAPIVAATLGVAGSIRPGLCEQRGSWQAASAPCR